MSNLNFKIADSIATDVEGYASCVLTQVEFDQYLNEETGELTEQILFVWDTTTRKGKETKIHFWTGMNINPTPRKVNGKTTYNALTRILLLHQIITAEDLKKLAKDESYIDELDIDLESMIGENHKFKLNVNEKGLAKPDVSSLKVGKAISVGVAGVKATEPEENEEN